jgi:hypothetical protein
LTAVLRDELEQFGLGWPQEADVIAAVQVGDRVGYEAIGATWPERRCGCVPAMTLNRWLAAGAEVSTVRQRSGICHPGDPGSPWVGRTMGTVR